ncbi:MAG TPA: glycosyltransferase [Desulfobacteraceae bacterium]|nr:glycosyltransferase [Desulfobacteraceae bacterium]HPQ27715.1 glycosyltransferase [Desulfobacteraceae bacterium]
MTNEQPCKSPVQIDKIKLGIVCPMANEKDTAEDFVRDILAICRGFREVVFFVIFDRSCKDGTYDLLNSMQNKPGELNIIWAGENTFVVDAYIRGYKEAINSGCDWILEIDAGYSHQPDEIPKFINKMAEGHECVFGSRFCRGGSFSESPFRRKFISRGGSMAANILLGTKLKDMTSGFELFTREALKKVLARGIKSRGHFFQTEIKTYCRKMKITEVPIDYRAPSNNVNILVLIDSFRHLLRLFYMRLAGRL